MNIEKWLKENDIHEYSTGGEAIKDLVVKIENAHEAELTTLRKDCQKIVSEVRVEGDELKKKLGEIK